MNSLYDSYVKDLDKLKRKLSVMDNDGLISYTLNRSHSTSLERELAYRLRDAIPRRAKGDSP